MATAIIAGTGIDEMEEFALGELQTVSTRFGEALVSEGELGGSRVWFLPRHGAAHSIPPAQINSRAQIAALKKLGVDAVMAVSAVGALEERLTPGSFVVLADFIDFTRMRRTTFFDNPDGPVVHTDLTQPYCPTVAECLISACRLNGELSEPRAVYVAVDGPRYETPAEIRLYSSWGGHVIGMTGFPEVALAREAGLCYGGIAVVSNLASGLSPTPLNHDEVRAAVLSARVPLQRTLRDAVRSRPDIRECACAANTALNV